MRRSQASKASVTAALVGEDVGMVPFGAGQDRDVRPVGVEVAGVLVGLDDERRRRCRGGRSPAGRRSRSLGSERADECRRIRPGRDERMDEPAGGRALAVRPGHADERPPDGRVGDDLLPRLERDAVPCARPPAPGCRGRPRSSALVTADALGRGGGRDVRGGVLARDHDPDAPRAAGVYGDGAARVAAGHDRRRRATARMAAALAPAPAAPTTWIRSIGRMGRADRARRQPGPDALRGGRHRSFASGASRARAARARSSRARRGAPPLVVRPVAVPDEAAGPRPRPRRRPRRRSARPASGGVPPSGPAMPVTETARSAPVRSRPPIGHRHRDLGRDRAVRREDVRPARRPPRASGSSE